MSATCSISVIIPAYNEATRIASVVEAALKHASEVIVVDDGSGDGTSVAAQAAGARVIRQENAGYLAAIKRGFGAAQGAVVVTMDADGEHCADDIPRLCDPILKDRADLVLGWRPHIARPSERFLNWLCNFGTTVRDSGTGFRAMRRELSQSLKLDGRCICGISVLEPIALGARLHEVPIRLARIDKPRRVAWGHLFQTWHVLCWLVRLRRQARLGEVRMR